MKYNIRRAIYSDIDAINKIMIDGINETVKYTKGDLNEIISWDDNIVFLNKIIEDSSKILLIAESGNKIIGTTFCYLIPNPTVPFFTKNQRLYVESIDVAKEYRKLGVGKELIKFIENIAREKHISIVEMESYSDNKNAVEFYQRIGYIENKKRFRKEIEN